MLIGLLEAETLPAKVVAEFGSYGMMFQSLLSKHNPDWAFRYYQADQGELPSKIEECDAYIITGSRCNAYDHDPWIKDLKSLVQEFHQYKKKCLGICFGHQLVAEALGGKVEKSPKGWGIGVAEFEFREKPHWMTDQTETFNILVSHQDQVIQLPPGSKLLCGSQFCTIGGLYVGNHILTLQGHPEFQPHYLARLIDKRRAAIGEQKSDKALKLIKKIEISKVSQTLILQFLSNSKNRKQSQF